MSSVASVYGRVPSLLASQISLRNLTDTNLQLLKATEQLSTLTRIQRPSDDPIAASLVSVFDSDLEQSGQRSRNLTNAASVLGTIDSSLSELSDMILESKALSLEQIGVGSDAVTRSQQSNVISQQLGTLLSTLNRDFAGLQLFSGSLTSVEAFEPFGGGGYIYRGAGEGMYADLGEEIDFPITISGDTVVGAVSARVEGDRDLNPALTDATFIRDLRGPMVGRELGPIDITIDQGTPVTITVDLSNAETVGDVRDILESSIRDAVPTAFGGAVVYPNGVRIAGSGDRLEINGLNLAPATTIVFGDGPAGETASALGLAGTTFSNAVTTTAGTLGPLGDLNPAISERTTLSALSPATPLTYGDIVIRNGTRSGTVTTNAGMTIGELREAVRRLDLGVSVEIGGSEESINFVNHVAGARMSIEEGGTTAATTLGVRSFMATTRIEDLNDGRGVEIADGQTDQNGNPDANRNVDFRVSLSDGSSFTVDLRPQDMDTVQTVVDRINAEFAAAAIPGGFVAQVNPTGNGIRLSDTIDGGVPMSVTSLNGYAAVDLGLTGGATAGGTGTASLTGTDPATVRVDSLVSTMVELQNALASNDERGIEFAGQRLDGDIERLASSRALVGIRAARVDDAVVRLEESVLRTRGVKSELQDLDFLEGSTRFSLLQTQLQSGLQVTAQTRPLSLLNFLG